MDRIIESLGGLFKWSETSSWTGIAKSMVVISFLALMGLFGYLGHIGYLSWIWLLGALGIVVVSGILFIIFGGNDKRNDDEDEDEKFDRWYQRMRQNDLEEEIANRDRRIETVPIIQEQLRALSYINGPENTGHSAVYEFHNGHSNPAGLGFQFAEMTAEEFGIVQHTAIQELHQKLPLGLLKIPHLLRGMEDYLWYGNKETLKFADPKLYMMVSNYVCEWLAIKLIKTSTEIGMLCFFSQRELSEEEIAQTIEGVNNAALIIGERLDYRDYKNR